MARAAHDPRSGATDRAVVAVGVGGIVVAGGLLGVLLVLDVEPPPTATRVLAALAAASLVAASSGTLRVSVLFDNVRSGAPELLAACAAAGAGLIVGGPAFASATGRSVGRLAPVVTIVLLVTVAWLGRGRRAGPRPVHPTAAVSAVIAAFLAASAATSLLALPDAYPISRYPMYAAARTGTYEVDQVRFAGFRDDGSIRELGGSLSRTALLRLVRDEDLDALEGFARAEAARDAMIVEVTVELETVAITGYPDPPGVEVVDRELVLRVATP